MNTITTETEMQSTHGQDSVKPGPQSWRRLAALVFFLSVGAVVGFKLFSNSPVHGAVVPVAPAVTVGLPLQKDIRGRLQFLGQFSAVQRVELRAQVGGTLTHIGFKDGEIVHQGDLLFEIDPTPYQIKLSEATAQLESAHARFDLASRELARAKTLEKNDAGTTENVDQRSAELRTA